VFHPIADKAEKSCFADRRPACRRLGISKYVLNVVLRCCQPAMMHAKILVVDQVLSVVVSTNFGNRSFGLNDEVNLAVQDARLASGCWPPWAFCSNASNDAGRSARSDSPFTARAPAAPAPVTGAGSARHRCPAACAPRRGGRGCPARLTGRPIHGPCR